MSPVKAPWFKGNFSVIRIAIKSYGRDGYHLHSNSRNVVCVREQKRCNGLIWAILRCSCYTPWRKEVFPSKQMPTFRACEKILFHLDRERTSPNTNMSHSHTLALIGAHLAKILLTSASRLVVHQFVVGFASIRFHCFVCHSVSFRLHADRVCIWQSHTEATGQGKNGSQCIYIDFLVAVENACHAIQMLCSLFCRLASPSPLASPPTTCRFLQSIWLLLFKFT